MRNQEENPEIPIVFAGFTPPEMYIKSRNCRVQKPGKIPGNLRFSTGEFPDAAIWNGDSPGDSPGFPPDPILQPVRTPLWMILNHSFDLLKNPLAQNRY